MYRYIHIYKWLELCSRPSSKQLFISIYKSSMYAAVKSLQSCPTLCDPIDGSPSGSTVPGILQARTLEWVVISFFTSWKWKVKVKSLSHVRLLATPWAGAHQAPPSVGCSRQECWSGVPLPSPFHVYRSINSLHVPRSISVTFGWMRFFPIQRSAP